MEILIIIGIIALIFYGYFQAKKQDTILIDDTFAVDHSIKITDPYKGLRDNPIVFLTGMTPKQYGELHGNGKSRVKKSNRLKLRK